MVIVADVVAGGAGLAVAGLVVDDAGADGGAAEPGGVDVSWPADGLVEEEQATPSRATSASGTAARNKREVMDSLPSRDPSTCATAQARCA